MPLSDLQIRNAKPSIGCTRKLADGGGLQLWVTPSGGKLWKLVYRFAGKQRKLSLGAYPAITLKDARDRRDKAKRQLAFETDPGQQKRLEAATKANTFSVIANELIEKKRRESKADATMAKIIWLTGMAREDLGDRPIKEITSQEVLSLLRKVEELGHHETARRLRSIIGECFRYAIATGRAETDPTYALRGALVTPKVKHRAALTEPEEFGGLLRAIDGYSGSLAVCAALKLLSLTFCRPIEIRAARWSEFDLENAVWSIPPERMKMRRPHKVPLAPQAIDILTKLRSKSKDEPASLLFPSLRSIQRPLSENTLNVALRSLGYSGDEMTSHGFRAVASTLLNESGKWNADAIEAQLAHVERNDVRRAYHRAQYWDERVLMMRWWADRLDELRVKSPNRYLARAS